MTNRLFARKGQWWFAVDRLIEDRNAGVTDAERQQLVADLEESPGVVSLCYLANIRVRPEMQEGGAAQLLSSFFRISITGKNREGALRLTARVVVRICPKCSKFQIAMS